MNNQLFLYTPLISLHKYRTVYEHNILFRKPPLLHPVSITRFPLRRFSPGAGLLRNHFLHRQWLRFSRGRVRKDGNLLTETRCRTTFVFARVCLVVIEMRKLRLQYSVYIYIYIYIYICTTIKGLNILDMVSRQSTEGKR